MNVSRVVFDHKKLRQARGVKRVKDVADAVGISPSMLCNYEAGTHNPSPTTLLRLCLLYGIEPKDLARDVKNLAA
jgi:transcriptional regulator with XRE-family HTH domain